MHTPRLKLYDLPPMWSDAVAGPQKMTASCPLMLLAPSAHADRAGVAPAPAVEHTPTAATSEISNTALNGSSCFAIVDIEGREKSASDPVEMIARAGLVSA